MKLISDFIGDFNFLMKENDEFEEEYEEMSLSSEDFKKEQLSVIENKLDKLEFYTITGVSSDYDFDE